MQRIFNMRTLIVAAVFCVGLVLAGALPTRAMAIGTTDVVVKSGDPTPNADGSFLDFNLTTFNDAGQAGFVGFLTGTSGGLSDNVGIFLGDGVTGPVRIRREGDAPPDADGSFLTFGFPVINNAGQAAVVAFLTGNSGGTSDNNVLYRSDGVSGTVQVAREGDAAPDANGSFVSFDTPVINSVGQVFFTARLAGTSGGAGDDRGFFRGDGVTGPVQLLREGDAAPDGNGSFLNIDTPRINDAGRGAFYAELTGTSGGAGDDMGLFIIDPVTGTSQLAREGDAAPDANGSFVGFDSVYINNTGQVLYYAELTGTSGGTSDDAVLFRNDGVSGTVEIARKGDTAPDANGSFFYFNSIRLNDVGQALFDAELTGTSGGTSDDRGLFLTDGASLPVQVARKGDAVPGANGSFLGFNNIVLNNAGQVAFMAGLTGTSGGTSDDVGLYFFDDILGLITVARKGDAFLGSTITDLSWLDGRELGLNENGQVVFAFDLANGDTGIAVWTVPEPASVALLMLSGLAVARRKHCNR